MAEEGFTGAVSLVVVEAGLQVTQRFSMVNSQRKIHVGQALLEWTKLVASSIKRDTGGLEGVESVQK